MMQCILRALAWSVVLTSPVLAGDQLPSSPGLTDPRVHYVRFHDGQIITATVGPFPTMIELDPQEQIVDVASEAVESHSASWRMVWHLKRNYLFIQSFAGAKPASLIVRTAAHSYIFDLLPNNAVRLSDQTRTARLVICLDGPPMTNGDGVHEHERLNAAYSIEVVHETEDIRPRDVFDDGRFTFMRFPGNLPIPAIYKSVPGSSEERLVNSHMEGEYVVLEGLSGLWNLRLGSTVLGVFNDAYHSEGRGADSGTTLPGVSRALR